MDYGARLGERFSATKRYAAEPECASVIIYPQRKRRYVDDLTASFRVTVWVETPLACERAALHPDHKAPTGAVCNRRGA